MNRTRLSQALLAAAVGAVALTGCGRDEPAPPAPAPAATPAEPAPPAPAPVLAPAAAPATVTLGNAIDADNRIATPLTTFASGDTIHASVASNGNARRLTATWTHLDSNQTVAEETKDVAAGAQTTDFHISKPDGWPTGRYRVEIAQDGNVINTTEFDVQ